MSRIFICNMKNYLNKEGEISNSLPKRVKKLSEHMGEIVTNVTTPLNSGSNKNIGCWNKINRKKCPGIIDASIDLNQFDILWHCLSCGDHGIINDWQHTPWDVSCSPY